MLITDRTRRRYRTAGFRVAAAAAFALSATVAPAQTLPDSLSDADFWKLVNEISEPGGYFRSDNFASNEWEFQYVIPELNRITKPGGVYMGVGPDQNFTYITALKPKMAFILDIRRQNMMLHLMYKSLMEMSEDRATFAAKLFTRPKPAGLTAQSTADQILNAVYLAPRQQAILDSNMLAIRELLTKKHGFTLTEDDFASMLYVYSTFSSVGPGITYNGATGTPTYWDLQVSTDAAGVYRAYMANEDNYKYLKEMHRKNLIVPLVGDFGGPKALRAIGTYLTERKATVTAFYLSNVEQYLFQSDAWGYFYNSVATLPLDSSSTFIRSVFNQGGGMRMSGGPGAGRTASLLASMQEQIKLFKEGRLSTYQAVIATSR